MEKATTIKDLINVFDLRPLENSDNISHFYVDTAEARGSDASAELMLLLKEGCRKNKKFLFIGHNGCGKSTELFKMAQSLKDDYLVIQYSINRYVDYLSASYVDILFSVLRGVVTAANENGIEIDAQVVSNIYHYWKDEQVITITDEEMTQIEAQSSIGGSFLDVISAKIKFFLQSSNKIKGETIQKVERTIPQLIGMINDFMDEFQTKLGNKELLIIIDDLDKLALTQARDIFIEHCKHITDLHANIVFTFPIYLYYTPEFHCVINDFDETLFLRMIKVKRKQGGDYELGIETIRGIIKKRADENLFEEGVIDFVIKKSGGCIRTALKILRDTCIKVQLLIDKTENPESERKITMDDVMIAYQSYKSGMERIIHEDHIELLKRIATDKKPIIDKDMTMVEFLMSLVVIEYNGERWCDLNPAIRDYLVEKKEIPATQQ